MGGLSQARWCYSHELQKSYQHLQAGTAPPGPSSETDHILPVFVFEFSIDWVKPSNLVGAGGQFLRMLKGESSCLDGFLGVLTSLQTTDSVSSLEPETDSLMFTIIVVVFVGQNPFKNPKFTLGFQDTVDLLVDLLK